MKDPIGIGVIGTGYWGSKLVYEYQQAERNKRKLRLLKVCDASLPSLLSCKKKFSLSDTVLTQNADDVFNDPNVSAVHIATPNKTHYPLAIRALESGKDVLIEKPMTLHSREAFDLVSIAASHELVLHVGHIFRFNTALQMARQALEMQAVGKVYYARVQWTDHCPPFHDRDIVFDLGPHPIDILNLLLGSWPTQASGIGRAYRNSRSEDEVAYIIAEFQDDLIAHIELSWLHPGKRREVSIVGSEGSLVVDCLNQKVARFTDGNVAELPVQANNTIESEIDAFVDAVLSRSTSVESGLIGAKTVEVLETITESMWDRPLPMAQQYKPDHMAALAALLEISRQGICTLCSTRKDLRTNDRVTENDKVEKYVGILMKSGFLNAISTKDGARYEVTEKGLSFLREYQEVANPDVDEQDQTPQASKRRAKLR